MAALKHTDSRRMYSWWWDSHISPKNSKWLQENLTDMDAKVKLMIKLIEEDADSFARRAEMYYKKRPELMKLVEESYRAYRALAERYDHATGALRQAHRTMSEAFPNQIPFGDDPLPSGSSAGEAPEMPHSIRALFDPDELLKEDSDMAPSQSHAASKRTGAYSDKPGSTMKRKGFKQVNDLFGSEETGVEHAKFSKGSVRKDQNVQEEDDNLKDLTEQKVEERDRNLQNGVTGQNIKTGVMSEYERVGKSDDEVLNLKQAIAKLEAEKEASLLQYQQTLEKISNTENKVFHAREESRELNERVIKAENEVETLKISLSKVEAEKEAGVENYLQCLESISDLETKLSHSQEEVRGLNDRASRAETEFQTLKQDLNRLEAENEGALLQYKQCLEKISDLENKLSKAEEEVRRQNERADKAEVEVQTLKQLVDKLNEAKEAATLQYQQCVNTISNLEIKISRAEEEATRLNNEVVMGVEKFNSAEEHHHLLEREYQSLQTEADTLMQKMGMLITHELVERDEELTQLRARVQEENMRFKQAEAALISMENLHAKSQEEQRSLELELENGFDMLNDMQIQNQELEDEILQLKDENDTLNEQNLSYTMSIKNLQDEVLRLKESEEKLKEEVEFRLDQRNALQQEIYCLKEEINELNGRYQGVIDQVECVGLKPDSLGLSVKNLQEENSKMKEVYQKEKEENVILLEKLELMDKLLEKNALLENSLSDVNVEREELRKKLKALEENCESLYQEKSDLVAEKAVLVSRLEIVTENLERLTEKNTFLENSLSDANAELEESRNTSKSLEESFQSIKNEKFGLLAENDTLVNKLESMRQMLEGLEKCCAELGEKHSYLKKEKESSLHEIAELRGSLDLEKQEHASFVQKNEILLHSLEDHIRILHEKHRLMKKEFEEEQDKAMKAQVEIFIWQKCIRDIEEKNFSLLIECQKHLKASELSEKLIMELEQKNLDERLNVKSLSNQVDNLKMGIHQVLKSLKNDVNYKCPNETEAYEILVQHIVKKIEDMDSDLLKTQDDKQQLMFEKSVLITVLQQVMSDLQESNLSLQNANSKLFEENRSLRKDFSNLKEEKCMLEEESNAVLEETMVLSYLCLILKSFGAEKAAELKALSEGMDSLYRSNGGLEEEIRVMREGMKMVETENLNFKTTIEKLENEFNVIRIKSDPLNLQIEIENDFISQKEMELNSIEDQNMDSNFEDTSSSQNAESEPYLQDMVPLVESIKSLENLVFSHIRPLLLDNQETKDAELCLHEKSSQELSENLDFTVLDGVQDLKDLQARVKAVEKALIEMTRLIQRENPEANIKTETGMGEKEKPKSRSNSFRYREVKTGKDIVVEPKEVELRHEPELEISNSVRNGIVVKDIPLDQVASSSSSKNHGYDPYAMSRRRSARINEEIMELQDTILKSRSINLTVSKNRKGALSAHEVNNIDNHQEQNSSSLLQEEKDMVVDKLEVFKRVSSAHVEGNTRKVLERLTSNGLKLSNLQITTQDLKKKVEKTPKTIRATTFEYDMVEGQLVEVGEAIMQLLDVNRKLGKNLEENFPISHDEKAELESDENRNVRRRRVSLEAQRIYDKIGRLQVEVQRMQFVLMKLDNEHVTEGMSLAPGRNRRVLLRDYLYGDRIISPRRRKRDCFCLCMRPATDED